MKNQKSISLGMFFLGALLVLTGINGTEAFARPDGRRGHSSPRYEHYVPHLPRGYVTIDVRGDRYYQYHGCFYRPTPSGFFMVAAPFGAVIASLPVGYREIDHGGDVYYFYNNTYYVKEPAGYAVVNPPAPVVVSNPVSVEAPEKTVVVNVPNANGSYMPVVLQKYSNGYTGPRGEFYPDYPTADQLKAMYALNSQAARPPVEDEPEEMTVNVPNANGSFTPVTLTKSAKGYVGPSGEFYPEKPTEEQLKMLYAKGNA
ncbi:MAG: DUF6515 family protein [Candidatus Omnitrophica bacterium]|nr:DUF6515 family protein [Candidatus Omnitrophota bacterium]MDD5671039.1 DUF6515 family protein [Candidatus Omnitrophota bacterium]